MSRITKFSEAIEYEKSTKKNNNCEVVGTLVSEPEFNHENSGVNYYMIKIETPYNGKTNTIPVLIKESDMQETDLVVGHSYLARGRFATKRKGENERICFLFTKKLMALDKDVKVKNRIVLDGYLRRNPRIESSYDKYTGEEKKQATTLITIIRPAGHAEEGEEQKFKSDTLTLVFRGKIIRAALQLKRDQRISVQGYIEEYKDKDGNPLEYPVVAYDVQIINEVLKDEESSETTPEGTSEVTPESTSEVTPE